MPITKEECVAFWFRRDLRLEDNVGLNAALSSGKAVLPIFIFDEEILDELEENDARVQFIHAQLREMHGKLKARGSSLICRKGSPTDVWQSLLTEFPIQSVFTNRDYEPYALARDREVETLLANHSISFHTFKDQVVFEGGEILKADGFPYTVYTPYKNNWLQHFQPVETVTTEGTFVRIQYPMPSLKELGFVPSPIVVPAFSLENLNRYEQERDFPAIDSTSYLSTHLRFGTVSVRSIIRRLQGQHPVFLNELIWREFFMQILYHFPRVVSDNFKPKYDAISWRNDPNDFQRWCEGKTGYPMVDAGMRQLLATGLMHNRVRMVVAGFLCKHLLIDWRLGEAWFAQLLLDYDLSANNGNWQWAAGTGCDAAPYFRVFNPSEQQKKFDPDFVYIQRWVPEFGTPMYPAPIVDHAFARKRALDAYKVGIESYQK